MLGLSIRAPGLFAGLLCLVLAACAGNTEPELPGRLDEPVDAFEAVGEPAAPAGASNRDQDKLSTDIERLQNARKRYRLEQERLNAERQRQQAECRAQPDSREVPINDGSGDPDATYCQPAEGGGAP